MKVLLTGGCGYIGSHTVVELLNKNYEVIVVDNFQNSSPSVLDRITNITGRTFSFIKCDIKSYEGLRNIFSRYKPECVMHFAGLKAVSDSIEEPLRYYKDNLNGILNLLSVMNDFKCKKIIFSSSATVYGDAQYLPIDETHVTAPKNPYGNTKLFAERIISDWTMTEINRKGVCLRYFNPIGAHTSGLLGENPNNTPNNLMPVMLQAISGQIDELVIFGDDYDTRDGTGERDYIHVTDLAIGHMATLEKIDELEKFQVINLGTGQGTTVNEIVSTMESVCKRSIPKRISARRTGDIAVSLADARLSSEVLGVRFVRSVEQMCRDSWNWHQRNSK